MIVGAVRPRFEEDDGLNIDKLICRANRLPRALCTPEKSVEAFPARACFLAASRVFRLWRVFQIQHIPLIGVDDGGLPPLEHPGDLEPIVHMA